MKKRIIITGGAGQDGIILSKLLIKKNYIVYSIINKKKFLKFPKINYLRLNLLNKDYFEETINNIKPVAIIHLAAKNNSANQSKKMNHKFFYKENFLITKNIIDYIAENNRKIKLIFAGSSQMFHKKSGYVNENSKFAVSCYYSRYKIDAHNYLVKIKKKFKLLATTAILFNHDSKYRNPKFLFPRLSKFFHLNQKKSINKIYQQNIFGDFSHAEDVCRGIFLLLKSKKNPDKIIFSSNKLFSINELIKYGSKIFKKRIQFSPPNKKSINLIGKNGYAKKLLGWKPYKSPKIAFKEISKK